MTKAEMKRRSAELRDLIAACGMSQREAAAALDRTKRMVEYWLSGDHDVPRTVMLAMRYLAEHPEQIALQQRDSQQPCHLERRDSARVEFRKQRQGPRE